MTDCTTPQTLKFSKLNRKKVEVKFDGGSISSDAGLLLLREVDKLMGLTKQVSKRIGDKRHSGYVKHGVATLLKQRVFAIAGGYEDVNDQDALRDDMCFQTCVGKEAVLGSSSTISRFENSIYPLHLKNPVFDNLKIVINSGSHIVFYKLPLFFKKIHYCISKVLNRSKKLIISCAFIHNLPKPFNGIQIWAVGW